MNIRKRPTRYGSKPNRPTLDYQTLEPRQLLAGMLNSSVASGIAGPTSLYYEVNDPIPVDQRMDVLRSHLQLDQHDQLRLVNLERDQLGFVHFKYQQYYHGIAVEGGTYKVHSRYGQVTGLSGDYQRVDDLSTNPKLTESDAFGAALDFVGAEIYAWDSGNGQGAIPSPNGEGSTTYISDFEIPEGQLAIVDNSDGEKRLAFKFDIYAVQPLSRQYVFIDAINGDIVNVYDRIHTIDTPASGTSLYNGTVNFTADDTGALFRLRQSIQGVETYTLNGFTSYSNATDITSISTTFTAPAVHRGVSAHYGVEQTMSFYQQTFGRNSFDGNGSIVQSFVSYGNGVNNAFWNGSVLTFGDGDGFTLDPLVSLDIVAHEFTHAVTQNSADLNYFLEPGALNESFSDVFGEVVEHFATGSTDWLVGEDVAIGNGVALRSMSNPKDFGDPDTYFGENWFVGGADNGGIHTNLGVQNKWFYLVAEGGSGINDGNVGYDIEGIGIQAAAAIAYRNLTLYLTPDSQYADARIGAIQSAVDLFGPGSPQHVTTEAAWDAVGVYDPNVELIPVAVESGTPGTMIYNIHRIDSFDLGFTDTYVIPLDAAQNLTVVLEGQGTLVPTIDVFDPTGALIAETTGSGNMAAIQSVPVTDGGFFFVVVGGADNTFGEYTMDVYLNADVELEFNGGPGNNDMNSAQSLETSSLGFSTPSQSAFFDRLAVVGSLANEVPTGTTIFFDSFETGALSPDWTSSSTGNGRITITTAYGSADGSYALLMDTSSGYALNEAILSLDLSAIAHPLLRFSQAEWGDETHPLPSSFSSSFNGDGISISNDGTNWYTVLTDMSSNSGEWNDVSIDLFEAAAVAGITLDENFQVKFQQYDNFSLPDDGRAFDAIEIVESAAPTDWYTFDVADGQNATAFATNIVGNNNV